MLVLSKGIQYKCNKKEYKDWLEEKAIGGSPPMPGRSWLLLHNDLLMSEAQDLLTRVKKEHQ
jgi:hypothetical protein